MRIPTKPPKYSDLVQKKLAASYVIGLPTAEIDRAVAKANNESWNWDDCKYRANLFGLTPDDFWFWIKDSRMTGRESIPLRDGTGTEFQFRQPTEVLRILRLIDLHLGGTVSSSESTLGTEPERERYLITSLQEEAISSSLIEGAVTTREQAREMIRNERNPKTEDERMILNNYRTIRFLNEQQKEPLTPELLCEVQRMLTEDTLKKPDAAGRFRLPSEKIEVFDEESQEVLHQPPPAEQLPERMMALCEFANSQTDETKPDGYIHPAIRAIALHFWLAYDHPFVDGNGRTARALFYWSMLRQGYWLTEYLSISTIIAGQPKQYARAYLDTEMDDNDLTYFILYHLRVIERSLKEFRLYVERKKTEQAQIATLLHGQFNARQQALLVRALKDPTARFSYESHGHSHGVTLVTARSDLLELESRGLLSGNRVGRRFEFSPAQDIDRVVKKMTSKPKKKR